MKKVLIVSFCMLFALTSLVMARPAAKENSPANYNIQIENFQSDLPLDFNEGLLSAAQADTFILAEYEFDTAGHCDDMGWYGVDMTQQPDTMFHVSTFHAINGAQSMWCGARKDTVNEPFCGYVALPGYGNLWNQYLTSVAFPTNGDVTVGFHAIYDSEPGYDFTYVSYLDTASAWVQIYSFTYYGDTICSTVIPADGIPGSIKLRFQFKSDGAWSDEDGLWDTQGAFIVDDISISDTVGVVESEDFEDEALGAHQTTDGDWVATPELGYGDFSGLFLGAQQLQQDLCTYDPTCLWGFFSGSTDDYGCGGHPEQTAVPYGNDRGQYITNEIWSPWIDLTHDINGVPVPATASSATYEFWDYRERPLDNLVFFVWHIRTRKGPGYCPGSWQDRNFVYYGPGPDWLHIAQPVGDLLVAGDTEAQLALGCWDMCEYWCGYYGTGNCHSHSPMNDRVKFYRINTVGPIFSVRDIDLFQDNFPGDGTTTGTVRIDMAIDRMPTSSPNIYVGDSVAVDCSEPNVGLGLAADNRAAIYCYVKVTGPHAADPNGWEAQEAGKWTAKRYPYLSGPTAGGFYMFQMDTSYQDEAMTNPTPDRYCFDLNDAYFTPPDMIEFYFAATDGNGNTSYWSQGTGNTPYQNLAEKYPMEMQCLPTGESHILYVDDFSGRGAQPYFDSAFEQLGITPDRYDVRGPTSEVANGPGARALPSQIVDVYEKIIWNSGDLGTGTIGDGTGNPEKSQDAQLLFQFLDQSSIWNPGLYISGDDIPDEMKTLNTPPFVQLFYYINYNLLSDDHVAYLGGKVAPLVIGVMPTTFFQHAGPPTRADTLIAYGGCPLINDFDVLEPTGDAVMQMYYDPDPNAGAVISQATTNAKGRTARVVLSGFSYHYIRDDRAMLPPDRVDHLYHILVDYFGNQLQEPTATRPGARLVNALYQNYPNPFNPTTTIKFSIKEKAHVSLKIYNVAGQLVKTLENGVLAPEKYTVTWKGLDNNNQPVASGVYFYKLVTKNFSQTKKMVLLK